MDPAILQALLTIAFGSIAGGTTNAIAVWMLFHPYEPPRVLGRRLLLFQGAIPKNKERLARTIGRTVGTKLLTSDDLANTVAAPSFRSAFDERLAEFVAGTVDRDWPSLAELLHEDLAEELRGLLEEIAAGLLDRLQDYLESEDFHTTVHEWAQKLATEIANEPLGAVLTPDREDAIAQAAERWIADSVESDGFERAINDYLDRGAARLLKPERTFQELLPMGLVAALERAIAGYLPVALERLGGLLDDPAAREKVERVLHEILDRFMRDLKFHQRLVAALIITPETVDRVLNAIEEEGAAKISELLQDSAVREAMARGVNNAIVDYLGRPVVDVIGAPGDESIESAKQTMAGWVLSLARDTHTRSFLLEKLRATLGAAVNRTWGDLFRHLPPDKVADALVAAARSDRARSGYQSAARQIVDAILNRRVGRIAQHLPPDAPGRIQRALAPPLWDWLQDQVPIIAERVDVAGRIQNKILEFPTAQVESLIRGVTERELKLIVRLGYVLGAFIGLASATIGLVFGG